MMGTNSAGSSKHQIPLLLLDAVDIIIGNACHYTPRFSPLHIDAIIQSGDASIVQA